VTSNVQRLQVLGRLLGVLKHDLLGTKAQLSDLLIDSPELDRQCKDHVDIHASRRRRPVLDQWRLVIIQQVHAIIRGHECTRADLLLHSSFLLGHLRP
jgi:hypothetical protein